MPQSQTSRSEHALGIEEHADYWRRDFLGKAALLGGAFVLGEGIRGNEFEKKAGGPDQALVAISLDLEMARNFPKWEDTHWDYEKGNLDAQTKKYALEAAWRV